MDSNGLFLCTAAPPTPSTPRTLSANSSQCVCFLRFKTSPLAVVIGIEKQCENNRFFR